VNHGYGKLWRSLQTLLHSGSHCLTQEALPLLLSTTVATKENPQMLTDGLQCLCWLHAEWVHPTLQSCTGADLDDIRGVHTNVEAQHQRNSCSSSSIGGGGTTQQTCQSPQGPAMDV
jgi:hypothetical protein